MVTLLDIQNGEIKGWIIANDTHELRRKFESLFDYSDNYRRDQCLSELYQMEFATSEKHELQSGYTLLVE